MPIEPILEPNRKTYTCLMYSDPKKFHCLRFPTPSTARNALAYGPTNYQISVPNGPPIFRRDFGPSDDPNPLGYRQWNHQHWNPC